MRIKSASPCTITVRLLFAMTFGRGPKDDGRLASPCGKTLTLSAHSVQSTPAGAWMCRLTSARAKYSGDSWVSANDPLHHDHSVLGFDAGTGDSREAEDVPKDGELRMLH